LDHSHRGEAATAQHTRYTTHCSNRVHCQQDSNNMCRHHHDASRELLWIDPSKANQACYLLRWLHRATHECGCRWLGELPLHRSAPATGTTHTGMYTQHTQSHDRGLADTGVCCWSTECRCVTHTHRTYTLCALPQQLQHASKASTGSQDRWQLCRWGLAEAV
jgi:hypothetical protein